MRFVKQVDDLTLRNVQFLILNFALTWQNFDHFLNFLSNLLLVNWRLVNENLIQVILRERCQINDMVKKLFLKGFDLLEIVLLSIFAYLKAHTTSGCTQWLDEVFSLINIQKHDQVFEPQVT